MIHTRVFQSLWSEQKRINAFRGGARSSKTFSILQAIAIWLITGYFGKTKYEQGTFAVVRETLPSLRASCLKDFVEILHLMGVYSKIDYKKTVLEFHFRGREVNFFSTDDLNSAKLRGRKNDFVYFNECNSGITKEAYNQLSMRCSYFIIMDYNPSGIESWVRTFIEGTEANRDKVKLDVSTYHDNIQNLAQPVIDEIEGYKDIDIDLYNVYAKGSWVKNRNLVFYKIHIIDEMPTEYDREYFGLDFGWHDPSVLCRVLKKGNNIYIEQVFYKSKMDTPEMARIMIKEEIKKTYTDHNSPIQVHQLKNLGVRTKKAKKGQDSIRSGVGYLRQHKIHILKSSIETIKDFEGYKYKLDENNEPTDKILEENDHAVDAVRYALSYALRSNIRVR